MYPARYHFFQNLTVSYQSLTGKNDGNFIGRNGNKEAEKAPGNVTAGTGNQITKKREQAVIGKIVSRKSGTEEVKL